MTLDAREQMIEFHTSLSMILVFTVKIFSVSCCKRRRTQIMMTLVSMRETPKLVPESTVNSRLLHS